MFLRGPRRILLLCGAPHVGKTTLIEYLYNYLKDLELPYHLTGFITKELREKGERIGFDLLYLRDPTLTFPLARISKFIGDFRTSHRIGKYLVFPENLERMLQVMESDLSQATGDPLFVIDEIGKMELLSEKFITFMENLRLDRYFLVATLSSGEHPFLRFWHSLEEAVYIEVTPENRDFLRDRLVTEFYRQGKLIVFEGIDGAGKTTLLEALRKDPCFSSVIFSQEPTHGLYGQKIRTLLKERKASAEELFNLFLSDRREHVEKLILPGLKSGKRIILDRYYLSTAAYQGIHFEDLGYLLRKNETFAPLPDLVIYLEVPVSLALRRIGHRDSEMSLFEREELLLKISQNYEKILALFPHIRISTTLPLEYLYGEVRSILLRELVLGLSE